MVGGDGALPLPWLAEPLQRGLQHTAHALLVHGPDGVGQFELALTLAQAWLCEARLPAPTLRAPCGTCASCRLVQAHSHPDLLVLVPDALREGLGWNAATGDGEDSAVNSVGKGKPSKEIKVESVRSAVAFAQTTSARGRCKVVVLHPAERMNPIAANALLKTLEEPPGDARLLLSCAAPDTLLPTLRSRCQALPLALPSRDLTIGWLEQRGVAEPAVLLAACGDQPLLALQWAQDGVDAKLWQQLPMLLARGESGPLMNWPLPRLIDALQKICHDALCVATGANPRYFSGTSIRSGATLARLTSWHRELNRIAAQSEHPWNAGLLVESLVAAAHRALAVPPRSGSSRGHDSIHSRP